MMKGKLQKSNESLKQISLQGLSAKIGSVSAFNNLKPFDANINQA